MVGPPVLQCIEAVFMKLALLTCCWLSILLFIHNLARLWFLVSIFFSRNLGLWREDGAAVFLQEGVAVLIIPFMWIAFAEQLVEANPCLTKSHCLKMLNSAVSCSHFFDLYV